MTRTRHYLNALLLIFIALFICNVAYAALYNITGTKDFVNGIPASLTTKERTKLIEMKLQAQTETACIGYTCNLLDKAKAKAKIKAIIAAETPPVVVPPVVVPPPSLMPFVDKTKEVKPAVGYNSLRIQPTSEHAPVKSEGAFRISCGVSHMSNDDPMVYPNQQGATHHHTFYGNTNIKYDTVLSDISFTGNSTCNGGTMNRSAYWHPTMVDTATNAPVIPDGGAIFYYKVGSGPASQVKAPPKGLRMLAGNPKATNASEAQATKYVCINIALQHSNGMAWQKTIPNCGTDSYLQMVVEFPSCWNDRDLDSPSHKDHVAYKVDNKCPTSHPVILPVISLNMNFKVHYNGQLSKWRLSSDNYVWDGKNAGYSGHADWVNGWDQPTFEGIIRNCLNPSKDCHAHLLGDGRKFE